MSSLPVGKFSYVMNTTDSSDYGQIVFGDDAVGKTPTQLREEDFFKYILQKCKYYKGIIYDHEALRIDGWEYGGDNWNGTEFPEHAPTCHLIKPFKFTVENIGDNE